MPSVPSGADARPYAPISSPYCCGTPGALGLLDRLEELLDTADQAVTSQVMVMVPAKARSSDTKSTA
jgi:hypothetical protein